MIRFVLLFLVFSTAYAPCPPAVGQTDYDANFPPPDANGNVVIGCVQEIPANKYFDCPINGTLTLPTCGSLTTIGDNAFIRVIDSDQEDLTIPDGVVTIGSEAFLQGLFGTRMNTGFKGTLTIPDSVTTIGSFAFGFNQFDTIRVGSGITTMNSNSFIVDDNDATTLQHVYAPNYAVITSWHPSSKYTYFNFVGSSSYELHIESDLAGCPTGRTERCIKNDYLSE